MNINPNRGISISLEGPDAGGKSLLLGLTTQLLKTTTNFPLFTSREPGGTPVGEKIRSILKSDEYKDMSARTNVLLFTAGRANLHDKVEIPFLESNPNGILLKDRSYLSTFVFQTVDGADTEYIKKVQEPFMDVPDIFGLIDIPVEETVVRMTAAQMSNGNREVDWRDLQSEGTLQRIREIYLNFAKKNPEKCILFDCFDDPWFKAAKIEMKIINTFWERNGGRLDKESFDDLYEKFSSRARNIVDTHETWIPGETRNIKTFDIDARREEVEKARAELGYPSREILQQQMHEKWQSMGLEGFTGGIERRK